MRLANPLCVACKSSMWMPNFLSFVHACLHSQPWFALPRCSYFEYSPPALSTHLKSFVLGTKEDENSYGRCAGCLLLRVVCVARVVMHSLLCAVCTSFRREHYLRVCGSQWTKRGRVRGFVGAVCVQQGHQPGAQPPQVSSHCLIGYLFVPRRSWP